jgi:hypothetical protein
MQCFAIVDLMVIVKLIHDYTFPNKFYFLIPGVIIGGINWNRYERGIDMNQLEAKWKDEPESRRVRNGWLIGLYLAVAFLIPMMYGYLHVNLKLI